MAFSLIVQILRLHSFVPPFLSRAKYQGRTKEEPRNDLGTPKRKKCYLLVYVRFWVPKSVLHTAARGLVSSHCESE